MISQLLFYKISQGAMLAPAGMLIEGVLATTVDYKGI